jgi:hypothetical protein
MENVIPLARNVVKGEALVSLARLAVRDVIALGQIRRVALTENIIAALGSRVAPIHAVHRRRRDMLWEQ